MWMMLNSNLQDWQNSLEWYVTEYGTSGTREKVSKLDRQWSK